MAVTSDEFPGTRIEDEVELTDSGQDPTVTGGLRNNAGQFAFKDSGGVVNPAFARVTGADTTTKGLDDKVTVSGGLIKSVVTPGGDETLNVDLPSTGVARPLTINPGLLITPGFMGIKEASDYGVFELKQNSDTSGIWTDYWTRSPGGNVIVKGAFFFRSSGGTDTVRMSIKIKSRDDTQLLSGAFDDEQTIDVSLTSEVIDRPVRYQFTITSTVFAEDDWTSIHLGREGSHANDNFNKSVFLLPPLMVIP